MPALGAGIHVLARKSAKNVDGRDKPGHDVERFIGDSQSEAKPLREQPLRVAAENLLLVLSR